jgi:hypothetical protein
MTVNKLKRLGRKRPWPDFRHCPGICLERLRKTTINLWVVGILGEIRKKNVKISSYKIVFRSRQQVAGFSVLLTSHQFTAS